jgi:signal transduction histidine kinase
VRSDPHGTLREICRLTTRVLDCDRVSVNLLDPESGYLLPAAVAGLTPEEDAEWAARQRAARGGTPFGGGVDAAMAGRLRDGDPVVVNMSRPPYRDLPNPYGSQVILVVPMRVGDELLGIVALDHRPRRPDEPAHVYTDDEIALARGIGQLAGLAVERQRLERVASEVGALRTANALKEEFLSIASHELKTPLTVLQARTQATQRRLRRMGYADAAAQFSAIQTALTRMLSLVEELLNASRIEAGRLDFQPEPCDLGALVAAAVDEQREISDRAIVLEGAEGAGLGVDGDPERLAQVLTNLLANGVKYSPVESPIMVRVARAAGPAGADEVVVTVADQGVGIPRGEIAHVFERFYRASTSSARQYGGLGLGLHIAATIVERHGGRIRAESPGPGLGSTFTIALPALARAAEG